MPEHRDLRMDKYGLTQYRYRELRNFCLQYAEKKRELAEIRSAYNSPQITGMPHGGAVSDPVGRNSERAAQLSHDLDIIEEAARTVCGEEWFAMVLAVASERMPYDVLCALRVVRLSRDKFYAARRRFFYELDKIKK